MQRENEAVAEELAEELEIAGEIGLLVAVRGFTSVGALLYRMLKA